MESNRSRFYNNPTIDPKSGDPIEINSKRFKQLVKKYGDVKVVSPKSGREIIVGKITYNNLLKDGYTVNELLNIKNNKNSMFTNRDELYIVMANSDFETIKNICSTNKAAAEICNDKLFWKTKINMDYPEITVIENWKKEYYKINEAYKNAEKIIKVFYYEAEYAVNKYTDIHMYIHLDKNIDIKPLLPKYLKDIDIMLKDIDLEDQTFNQYVFVISMDEDKTIGLDVFIDDDEGDIMEHFNKDIKVTDLKDLLFKVLYYYPDEEIVDENGFSYLLKPLKMLMDISFKVKDQKYTSQYKNLKKRLNYLKTLTNV